MVAKFAAPSLMSSSDSATAPDPDALSTAPPSASTTPMEVDAPASTSTTPAPAAPAASASTSAEGAAADDRVSTDSDASQLKRDENDATPSLASNSSFSSATEAMRREQAAIIFDWDDTLLPSSWLAANELRLDSPDEHITPEHRAELEGVERHVLTVLQRALELGEVHLVTNAETGWIELSSEKFMPRVARMLPRLQLVSARSKYEPLFPNNPSQWKIEAFRETLRAVFDLDALPQAAEPVHVISLGDSHHERQALHVSTSELKNTHVKSIKFVERPEMDVLRRELELVAGVLDYIVSHQGDLDLMLSPSLLFSKDTSDQVDMQDLLECAF